MPENIPQFEAVLDVLRGDKKLADVNPAIAPIVRKIVRRSKITDFHLFSMDPRKMKLKNLPGNGVEKKNRRITSRELD